MEASNRNRLAGAFGGRIPPHKMTALAGRDLYVDKSQAKYTRTGTVSDT